LQGTRIMHSYPPGSPKTGWEELISGMRPGRSGSELAVHQPLFTLLLLGRAQRGESNQVSFREIDAPLREALERFGPCSKRYSSELAFWHLQSAGYWVVEEKDTLPRRKGKDRPTRTGLLDYDAKGYVPPQLWDELLRDPALIRKLAGQILDTFWPKSVHDAILGSAELSMAEGMAVARNTSRRDEKS